MWSDGDQLLLAAGLDPEAVLDRLGGSIALLSELAGLLLEECPRWLAEMTDALGRGDASALQFTAHLLRGSVGGVGAWLASEAAGVLEDLARAGDLDAAAGAYDTLEAAIHTLQPALLVLAQPDENMSTVAERVL